ncbi:MAG: hypothetical protein Q7U53_07095 [Anaerolineaceae bacterium]|nr:hypothetical protein [Anaerolineaceae bacterium]
MSSKIRKNCKFLPNLFMLLGAVSVAFAMLLSMVNLPVSAGDGNPEITCPSGGGWDKVDLPSDTYYEFTYDAPPDKLIERSCWKSGTTREITFHVPPVSSVTFTNSQYLSHYSIFLGDKPDPTPDDPTDTPVTPTVPTDTPVTPTVPTDTPVTPTVPTDTPVTPTVPTDTPVTPTVPTDTPVTPTVPTDTPVTPTVPTDTPVTPTVPTDTPVTPIPDEPSPTPVDPGQTSTPDVDETPDPTNAPTFPPPTSNDPPTILIPVTGSELDSNSPLDRLQSVLFNLGLSFLGLGLVLQSLRKKINL